MKNNYHFFYYMLLTATMAFCAPKHPAYRSGAFVNIGIGPAYDGQIGINSGYQFKHDRLGIAPIITFGLTNLSKDGIGYSIGAEVSHGYKHQAGIISSFGTVGWETILNFQQHGYEVSIGMHSERLYGVSIIPFYRFCSNHGITGTASVGFSIGLNAKTSSAPVIGPQLGLGIGYKI